MSSVPNRLASRHRNSLEAVSVSMARADLKNLEGDFKALIGQAIQRAFSLAGWSQKEAAGRLDRDPAQVARWIAGTERPQMDALFVVEELRWPLIQTLAALAQAEVVTEIRKRA
jgi:ribosome-binding protein aMBF1 (putative translation factor)